MRPGDRLRMNSERREGPEPGLPIRGHGLRLVVLPMSIRIVSAAAALTVMLAGVLAAPVAPAARPASGVGRGCVGLGNNLAPGRTPCGPCE